MRPHLYRISVVGHLGDVGRAAFEGVEIVRGVGHTDLVGNLDQAALFGLLARVNALALELVEVRREDRPARRPRRLPRPAPTGLVS